MAGSVWRGSGVAGSVWRMTGSYWSRTVATCCPSRYAQSVTAIRSLLHALRRTVVVASYVFLMLVLAVAAAGIVALWTHPAGTASRAELTWNGDVVLREALDGSSERLTSIAVETDRLALLARGAVGALTQDDQAPFNAALAEGATVAAAIEAESATLRSELEALPGAAAEDALGYGGAVVARRAAMLSALDATAGLSRSWTTLTAGSLQASGVITLLVEHDRTVAAAAAQGRSADYAAALGTLADAVARLDAATVIRDRLANSADVATLDTWVARNRRYDEALISLYGALRDAGGVISDAVRAAYQEEGLARAALPPDTRGLVVILADIGQGGLNQAVIAIDQARERLNLALEALAAAVDRPALATRPTDGGVAGVAG